MVGDVSRGSYSQSSVSLNRNKVIYRRRREYFPPEELETYLGAIVRKDLDYFAMMPSEGARFEQRSVTTLDRLATSTHTLLSTTRPIRVLINPAHSMKGAQVVRKDDAPRTIKPSERALNEWA